jgi:hypothetical protein
MGMTIITMSTATTGTIITTIITTGITAMTIIMSTKHRM